MFWSDICLFVHSSAIWKTGRRSIDILSKYVFIFCSCCSWIDQIEPNIVRMYVHRTWISYFRIFVSIKIARAYFNLTQRPVSCILLGLIWNKFRCAVSVSARWKREFRPATSRDTMNNGESTNRVLWIFDKHRWHNKIYTRARDTRGTRMTLKPHTWPSRKFVLWKSDSCLSCFMLNIRIDA